jgi:nucleotide-binding universal stress UspA family protein
MSSRFAVERILIPVDFSAAGEATAQYMAGFARHLHAEVSLLHVVPIDQGWIDVPNCPYYVFQDPIATRTAAESALKRLEKFSQDFFPDSAAKIYVKNGAVSDCVVDCAKTISASLIAMPTSGTGRLRRFLIGSTTAKILHDSCLPLWTSPHVGELGVFRPYRHVICALDYRALSADLLAHAQNIASQFQARLSIVSALPTASTGSEWMQRASGEHLAAVQKLESETGVQAPIHVGLGNPGEIVAEVANTQDADLIVIGHGHLTRTLGHFRTHAYDIIGHAPVPVIVT